MNVEYSDLTPTSRDKLILGDTNEKNRNFNGTDGYDQLGSES